MTQKPSQKALPQLKSSRLRGCVWTIISPLIWASLSIPIASCGGNVIASYAPKNEQEKAELDMEAGKYSQAAERLNSLLTGEPDNHSARSLLAAAYAAQAGITTLGLIKNASSSAASGQNSAQRFNNILPEAISANLTLMGQACDAMALIPADARTTEIRLQHGLFFSAYAFLQIKYFTTQAEALAALTTADALKLIQTLAQAAEAGGSSPLSKAASTFSTSISSAPGESVDKVKSVLSSSTP